MPYSRSDSVWSARAHSTRPSVSDATQCRSQGRLAHPRFAFDGDQPRLTLPHPGHHFGDPGQLGLPSDEGRFGGPPDETVTTCSLSVCVAGNRVR